MIYFQNPGEIDIRAITTLGVNVKDSDNAIGFFGTGAKYAIAGALRLGGKITIYSGLCRYDFSASQEAIRGKSFAIVTMNDQPLGFTTELGKHWEPWMYFRELLCNARDEGGEQTARFAPAAGTTLICVECEEIEKAAEQRDKYFLRAGFRRLAASSAVEVFAEPSTAIFYQGVKVAELPQQSMFTYNIIERTAISEDRQMPSYNYNFKLGTFWTNACHDTALLSRAFSAAEPTFERNFDWCLWGSSTPSETAKNLLEILVATNIGRMPDSLFRYARRHVKVEVKRSSTTAVEQQMIERSLKFLKTLGYDISFPIEIAANLGDENVFGLAQDGKILLAKAVFNKGTKYVAGTILEEYLHLEYKFQDESRRMQNYLLDKIMSLGEEIQGAPL